MKGDGKNFFITSILFLAILLVVFPATISKAAAQDTDLSFRSLLNNNTHLLYSRQSFSAADNKFINATGDASISKGALQIITTTDTSNPNYVSLLKKAGRCMFSRPFRLFFFYISWPFRLWDTNSDDSNYKLISFTSIFHINIVSPPPPTAPPPTNASRRPPPGEGLTFLITSDLEIPPDSSGRFLGLTNRTHDGNSENKFIAIEFDTVKEDENQDPSDNHMGLNFNSVLSNKTVNLSDIRIASGTNYTVWIKYDGETKVIDVYMGLKDEPKPHNSFLSEKVDLREHLNEYSYFGFSASTGNDTAQLNCILKWDLTVEILPQEKGRRKYYWRLMILEVVVVPGVLIVLVICGLILGYYLHKRRNKVKKVNNNKLVELPGVPKKYTLEKLKKATNNFDEKMKLGQGGFGAVYKGVLSDTSEYKLVAVKKFSREILNGELDFLAELNIINRLRHKNLVRLAGWCYENGMFLLVYEFMPNGSLDHHLYPGSNPILKWNHRYKIASGVASALDYLHNHNEQKVLHRDLKPGNILLDSDYNARVGDFGIARLIERGKTSFSELERFAGTPGYIAPECFHTGKATKESDVFGFGTVMLELICGKHPWTEEFGLLVDWVWKLHAENRILEAIDDRLGNDYIVEEAHKLLLVGLACAHPIASERPKTETIFQIISGAVPVPSVSPDKPQESAYYTLSEH